MIKKSPSTTPKCEVTEITTKSWWKNNLMKRWNDEKKSLKWYWKADETITKPDVEIIVMKNLLK